jgi:hypothetical protein
VPETGKDPASIRPAQKRAALSGKARLKLDADNVKYLAKFMIFKRNLFPDVLMTAE